MAISSYRDLMVWQEGIQVSRAVYDLTERFPKQEQYALTNQIQRAAVSIPANIAEGHARESTKEFLHHLSIARGSLAELETFLELAVQLRYCTLGDIESLTKSCEKISRMLSGLRNRLKERLKRPSSPAPRP
jgi:four helix bundle protein